MVLVLIVFICGVAIVYCFGKFVGCENFVYTTCVLDGLRPSSLSKSQRKTAEEYTFSLTSPGENQVTALKWMRSIRDICVCRSLSSLCLSRNGGENIQELHIPFDVQRSSPIQNDEKTSETIGKMSCSLWCTVRSVVCVQVYECKER